MRGNFTGGLPNESLRSEEHTSELQSHHDLVCRLLLEKKKPNPAHKPKRRPSSNPRKWNTPSILSARLTARPNAHSSKAATSSACPRAIPTQASRSPSSKPCPPRCQCFQPATAPSPPPSFFF